MDEPSRQKGKTNTQLPKEDSAFAAPSISLPKGGGAIRGMGEKFAANPVTGTGSMSVPIATSPARAGFGPQLSLSYDSGAGNGPFGFGWSLSLPSITRKTDKGLPQYLDREESDVFILSGAEDLVPLLNPDGSRFKDTITAPGYTIHRYRPRIEGLFARIERWTRVSTGEVHWRSISKDNITTLYGKGNNAKIFDPADPDPVHPTRIFTWLICESYDDKGNALTYTYKAEDDKGIDIGAAHERNRLTNKQFAQRYLKRIQYGNRTPHQANEDLHQRADWMFEVVLDYGEHYAADAQGQPAFVDIAGDARAWPVRADAFSTCRAGFEVRTSRLCRRVLMFHHFPSEDVAGVDEPAVGQNCLVRATEFSHEETRIASYLIEATQASFRRKGTGQDAGYIRRALPPLQFAYSKAEIQVELKTIDADSLENVPYGIDGAHYQFVDLYGEGVSGVLTDQAGAWFYKRNLSPLTLKTARETNGRDIAQSEARFAPIEQVALKPAPGNLGGGQQVMDLGGDGQNDLVQFAPPLAGYFSQDTDGEWQPFVPFRSQPNLDWNDPNLRHVELTGDGHADVLITQEGRLEWYRSLAKDGFEPALFVTQPLDDEQGPRLVFADGTQSVYLADMNGDGLTDLVRIGNGNVCYWPSLGYGRFGAKVTMSDAPRFDYPDQFDQTRIRLADIDGSGVADILYLGRDAITVSLNESGNSWADAQTITAFPRVDNLASVQAMDLLGNGTACLVWSSPLSCDARQPMRYVDLMGGQKPHLLVKTINNLGAETRVQYAPSTKFYLQDKLAGTPWITKLPFPVHVVERVETFDQISRNWFVTRYQYHHGYFDGAEREFRGFGMIEQFDTEAFDTLQQGSTVRLGERADTNINPASHVPPIHTKTWFHTGAYFEDYRISQHFIHEYYGRPKETDIDFNAKLKEFESTLLDDTILPLDLTAEEEREACRALKGAMLRQEVYALDGSGKENEKEKFPYTVTEQNFTIEILQPHAGNRHAVFFTHPREAINYHYERNPADPRVSHAMTLKVDAFGNVERSIAVGYPRANVTERRVEQNETHLTLTLNRVANRDDQADWYRVGLPVESRTYEVVKPPTATQRFTWKDLSDLVTALVPLDQHEPPPAKTIPYEQWDWRKQWNPQTEPGGLANTRLRLIEHVRTLYRKDNLTTLLALGAVESLALPGESYKLAFTPGLLNVYAAKIAVADLLPILRDEGKYIELDNDGHWWIASGRMFFLPAIPNPQQAEPTAAEAAQELTEAQQHFFLPRRYRDPFWNNAIVDYDGPADPDLPRYDLLVTRTEDSLQNVVRAEINYRVLQPWRMTDPNGNHSEAAFDTLGLVVASAIMGKNGEGDKLEDFKTDLPQAELEAFFTVPRPPNPALLGKATTHILYDIDRWRREGKPAFAATLARETHVSDPLPPQGLKIQVSFSYSDGFGREIQKKIQAEKGPLQPGGADVEPRWVGSGWTIFNNKGKPVRQYEPFFDDTHDFKFGEQVGVSLVLFYDPAERVVATLHPNHTYEKVVFDPWQQTSFDVNDTLKFDPKTDEDVRGFFTRLPDADYLPTWFARMSASANTHDNHAAQRTEAHANTPTIAHFDALGRPFLTIADNGAQGKYETRVDLDIEGNQRNVTDARGHIVMRYDYDMLGTRIKQASMEAGARWMLNNVAGKPIRAWDDRSFIRRMTYDKLHRPTGLFVTEPAGERLAEQTIYGEDKPTPADTNHRGKVWQVRDDAGIVISDEYDFKGNLKSGKRNLRTEYKTPVNWAQQPAPTTSETFTSSSKFDALGRVIEAVAPDGSVTRPRYNEANLLEAVDVRLRGALQSTPFVRNIDYDAKGQRTRIEYNKNDTPIITEYTYDPDTFRLTHLVTTRPNHPEADKRTLQDLRYTYDPAGNITHIQDDAQQTIYFRNQRVEPSNDYVYDAVYRLLSAQGREHLGQTGGQRNPPTAPDAFNQFHTNLDHPGNGDALGIYIEEYDYDAVGNFKTMRHRGTDPVHPGWTRNYVYNEASLIEPITQKSNRLSSTQIGAGTLEPCTYDAHGNMITMPHLPHLRWDFEDQLTEVDLQGGGTAYYVYDAAGQRARKVIERNGATMEEHIYLGGHEVYRKRQDGALQLERETLYIMDDKQRIALVETRTQGNDGSPPQLIRYQFGNHLGLASLELDDKGSVITYEEYTPYGSTSYQAVRSQAETPKRYRYTGKERDEESGLYYHGARYYAPWLGRWTTTDPLDLADGVNVFVFVSDNPVRLRDLDGRQGIEHGSDVRLNLTPEQERSLQETNDLLKAVETDLERRVNSGEFSKKTVNAPTPPRYSPEPAPPKYDFSKKVASSPVSASKKENPPTRRADAGPSIGTALPLPDDAVRLDQGNHSLIVSEENLQGFLFVAKGQGELKEDVKVSKYSRDEPDPDMTPEALAAGRQVWDQYKQNEIANSLGVTPTNAPGSLSVGGQSQWGSPSPVPAKPPTLTYAQGYSLGFDLSSAGLSLVLGKYPGNVQYVATTSGTFTIDRAWGWSRMYNAGGVRGAMEARGRITLTSPLTSQNLTGAFGLEVRQIGQYPNVRLAR